MMMGMMMSEAEFNRYKEEFNSKPWGMMIGISEMYLHLLSGGVEKISELRAGGDRVLLPKHDHIITIQFPYFAGAFREAVMTYFTVKTHSIKDALLRYMMEALKDSLIMKDLEKKDLTAWVTILTKKDYKAYLRRMSDNEGWQSS